MKLRSNRALALLMALMLLAGVLGGAVQAEGDGDAEETFASWVDPEAGETEAWMSFDSPDAAEPASDAVIEVTPEAATPEAAPPEQASGENVADEDDTEAELPDAGDDGEAVASDASDVPVNDAPEEAPDEPEAGGDEADEADDEILFDDEGEALVSAEDATDAVAFDLPAEESDEPVEIVEVMPFEIVTAEQGGPDNATLLEGYVRQMFDESLGIAPRSRDVSGGCEPLRHQLARLQFHSGAD